MSQLTDNLRNLQQVQMDADTARRQRDFLLERIGAEQVAPENAWQSFWHVFNHPYVFKPFAYVTAVFVLFVTGTFYTMSAATQSEPGGTFYPVKLKFEQLQVAFENNDTQRAKKQIEYADRRLTELSSLQSDVSPVDKQEKVATVVKHFNDSLQDVKSSLEKAATAGANDSNGDVVDVVALVNNKSTDFADVLSTHSDDLSTTVKTALEKEVQDIKNYSLEVLVAKYQKYRDRIPESIIIDQLQEKIIALGEEVSTLEDEDIKAEALEQLSAMQELLEDRQFEDALAGIKAYEQWFAEMIAPEDTASNEGEVLGEEEIVGDLEIHIDTTSTTSTIPVLETQIQSEGEIE